MKSTTFCLALALLASSLPSIAQTNGGASGSPSQKTLSAETLKMVTGVHSGGHLFIPISPQEKVRVEAGMAKANELSHAGEEALHLKNFAVAEADYRELVQMQSDIPNYYYGLGEALAGQGKTAEALAVYKTVVYWPLNTGPGGAAFSRSIGNPSNLRGCCGGTDALAWLKYALLLSQTGQNAEAFSVYSKAILQVNDANHDGIMLLSSNGPSSPAEFQAAAHIALGLLTGGMLTDHEQAMSEFEQAQKLAPDAAVTNFYYGYGWKRLDLQSKTRLADAPQAKAALQKAALADDPNVKKAAGEELRGLR